MAIRATTRVWVGFLLAGSLWLSLAPRVRADEAPIVIKGSNTFGEELAPALIRKFQSKNPAAKITLESKGSDTGLVALLAGDCDIASSSRRVTDDERRLARSRGLKLNVYLIGFYGVAVIVHPANPVTGLTDREVRDVFTGRIEAWSALGGADSPVHLYIRDPSSGTYLGFQELAMARKPYAPTATALQRYEDIAAAVAGDRNGVGYVSLSVAQRSDVRAIRINRVPASALTVNSEEYPYARALRLVTVEGRETRPTLEFIHFVLSRPGQQVLSDAGFVRRDEQSLLSPEL